MNSKKCWVKYNPALGKIWTNPAIGLFLPSGWVTVQKVGLNIWLKNNSFAGFVHI